MVRGLTYLLLFQLCGEIISAALDLPIPGNVMGMGLLLIGLMSGWVEVRWLEDAVEVLLSNMALFFVPAGVGVMVYSDLIAAAWLPITVATIVSTFVVMAVTGVLAQKLENREQGDVD